MTGNVAALQTELEQLTAAEDFCKSQGGGLASVGSVEENEEVNTAREENVIWLGGSKKAEDEVWQWLDSTQWTYQNWDYLHPKKDTSTNYLTLGPNGLWQDNTCFQRRFFVCDCPKVLSLSGRHTFTLTKESQYPSFHLWWSHKVESKDNRGIQISWRIENGSRPDPSLFESQELS